MARGTSHRRACRFALTGAALALLSGGCALFPPSPPIRVDGAVQALRLDDVPFHPQEQFQCGPAALASALAASGVTATPEALAGQVYLPGRRGSLQADLISATRHYGRIAYPVTPDLSTVIRLVSARIPVLVLQNLGGLTGDQWHYAVVFGYDLRERVVHLRSGDQSDLSMDFSDFDRTWAAGGRWAIAVLAPDHLPPGADEAQWLLAAAPLERTAPAAAALAYRTALSQWPQSLVARLGLGNLNYAKADLAAARDDYAMAVRDHPQSGDAWNNLAQVLLDLQDLEGARQMAEHALAIGGEHAQEYQRTFDAIEAARAPVRAPN